MYLARTHSDLIEDYFTNIINIGKVIVIADFCFKGQDPIFTILVEQSLTKIMLKMTLASVVHFLSWPI